MVWITRPRRILVAADCKCPSLWICLVTWSFVRGRINPPFSELFSEIFKSRIIRKYLKLSATRIKTYEKTEIPTHIIWSDLCFCAQSITSHFPCFSSRTNHDNLCLQSYSTSLVFSPRIPNCYGFNLHPRSQYDKSDVVLFYCLDRLKRSYHHLFIPVIFLWLLGICGPDMAYRGGSVCLQKRCWLYR